MRLRLCVFVGLTVEPGCWCVCMCVCERLMFKRDVCVCVGVCVGMHGLGFDE